MSDTASAAPPESPLTPASVTSFSLLSFASVLILLLLVSFPDVLLGWRSFFTRDFANFGYPLACHVQQSYRAGAIPFWNPYNFAGLPFLAQWNTLALYPPSLIYILLPLPWSLNLFNLLHLFLGGLGMFCLARRWLRDGYGASVAGISYAFSGLLVSSLMWPNNIAALGWLPFVLLYGERAAREGGTCWLRTVLVMAFQFLAGAPEITALTWAGLGLVVLFEPEPSGVSAARRFGRLMFLYAFTLGLTAVQLLPFLELLGHSQRGAKFASGEWSLAWSGLGNFLVPLFHTVQSRDRIFFQSGQQWITSYYPGITVVALSLVALLSDRTRRTRLLALLGLVSLILALPMVYHALRRIVPGLGVMRYPIKFIVPVSVVLPLLAGWGVRAWFRNKAKNSTVAGTVTCVALASLALMSFSQWHPVPGEVVGATWRSGLAGIGWLIVCCGALFWNRRTISLDSRWLAPLVLTLGVYGDLFFANRHLNPVVHPELLTGEVAELNPRPELGNGRAMVTQTAQERLDNFVFTSPEAAVQIPRRALLLDDNLVERLPKLDGFFSLYLPRSAMVMVRLASQTNANANGLMDFLGVSQVSRPGKPWEWEARTNWLPLASLASRPVFLDPKNTFVALFSDKFHPREEVFLPPEATGKILADGTGRGKILAAHVNAHEVMVTVETTRPMLLTLAQANYPGWRATVDGTAAKLWTANYAFQALEIPAGRHEARITYHSTAFYAGVLLSGIALAVLFAFALFSRRIRSG